MDPEYIKYCAKAMSLIIFLVEVTRYLPKHQNVNQADLPNKSYAEIMRSSMRQSLTRKQRSDHIIATGLSPIYV